MYIFCLFITLQHTKILKCDVEWGHFNPHPVKTQFCLLKTADPDPPENNNNNNIHEAEIGPFLVWSCKTAWWATNVNKRQHNRNKNTGFSPYIYIGVDQEAEKSHGSVLNLLKISFFFFYSLDFCDPIGRLRVNLSVQHHEGALTSSENKNVKVWMSLVRLPGWGRRTNLFCHSRTIHTRRSHAKRNSCCSITTEDNRWYGISYMLRNGTIAGSPMAK